MKKKMYFQKKYKKLAPPPPPPKKKVPVFHAQDLKHYSLCEVLSFQEVSQESLKYWQSYRHSGTLNYYFLIGDLNKYLRTVFVARIFVILLI